MSFAKRVLTEQRRRCVGSLMSHIEQQVYPHLDERALRELRAKVLGTVNAYHELCLDMVSASINEGTVINEEAVRMIARIHGEVTAKRGAGDG